ncbi:hypothetical protein KA107_02355 [Candidatus Pacearchaeota archaeon]|nr:hypothetical protein [Candidatus Pacearchaeota archaeon]
MDNLLKVYIFKRPEEFGNSYVMRTSDNSTVDLFAVSKDIGFMVEALENATNVKSFAGRIKTEYYDPKGMSLACSISEEDLVAFEGKMKKVGLIKDDSDIK